MVCHVVCLVSDVFDVLSRGRAETISKIAITVNTREKVEHLLARKRLSLSGLARNIGERKQTVAYWLDNPDAPRDKDAWTKIGVQLGVAPDILTDDNKDLPEWATTSDTGPRLPVNQFLLDMLLRVLEDPSSSAEDKESAKATIRLWLRDFIQ